MSRKTQLFQLVSNIEIDSQITKRTHLHPASQRVTTSPPALFAFYWPNGSPCALVEMYLHARSLEVTVVSGRENTKSTGGTLRTIAAQLTHIVRYAWEYKIDFWQLTNQDLTEFQNILMSEKKLRHPAKRKRENNTIISIVNTTLDFILWLNQNLFVFRSLIGPSGSDANIKMISQRYLDHHGKTQHKLRLPTLLPKSTPSVKTIMPEKLISRLWEAVAKMADPNTQSPRFAGKFPSKDALIEELIYLKKRRELLLTLLEFTGARPGEICLMQASKNLESTNNSELIIPTLKRRRYVERKFPAPNSLSASLCNDVEYFIEFERKKILSKLGKDADPQDIIFLSVKGKPLSVRSITVDFTRIVKNAGINDVRACMSMFRHRFITRKIMSYLTELLGADPRRARVNIPVSDFRSLLRKVLVYTGHANETSLFHYLDMAWDEFGIFRNAEETDDMLNALDNLLNKMGAIVSTAKVSSGKSNNQSSIEDLIKTMEGILNNQKTVLQTVKRRKMKE